MILDNQLPARAGIIVVVDDTASLKVRIDGNRADVLKAPLLQILADLGRQAVADRDLSFGMALIEEGLTAGEAPKVVTQASELVAQFLTTLSIADHGLYLPRRADHALGIHDAFYIGVVVSGHLIVIEIIKALPKDVPLAQDDQPAEAALQVFQGQMLKHLPIVVNGNPPFVVMIRRIERICTGPFAIPHRHLPFRQGFVLSSQEQLASRLLFSASRIPLEKVSLYIVIIPLNAVPFQQTAPCQSPSPGTTISSLLLSKRFAIISSNSYEMVLTAAE